MFRALELEKENITNQFAIKRTISPVLNTKLRNKKTRHYNQSHAHLQKTALFTNTHDHFHKKGIFYTN